MENTNESHICFIVPRWWHSVIFEGYFSNLLIVKDLKSYVKKLAPYGECYCNCKSINWTETLPSSKSRDTKTRTHIKNLLHTKVGYCSVVSESVVICQLTLKMAEEIDFENWRITNFKGLVTLTLTLDRVIRHTVVHHSSTSTCIPNLIGIGKTFYGRTYGHETHIIRSTLHSRPKNRGWDKKTKSSKTKQQTEDGLGRCNNAAKRTLTYSNVIFGTWKFFQFTLPNVNKWDYHNTVYQYTMVSCK